MKLTKTCLFLSALTAMLLGMTSSASAQIDPLQVRATVVNACTITTTAVNFGNYNPLTTGATDAAGALSIACTAGSAATIGLGLGSQPAGSVRQMADSGSNRLAYELYVDSGRTNVWGTVAPGVLVLTSAPSTAARTSPVYGRIEPGLQVPSGNYTDSVVATVNF